MLCLYKFLESSTKDLVMDTFNIRKGLFRVTLEKFGVVLVLVNKRRWRRSESNYWEYAINLMLFIDSLCDAILLFYIFLSYCLGVIVILCIFHLYVLFLRFIFPVKKDSSYLHLHTYVSRWEYTFHKYLVLHLKNYSIGNLCFLLRQSTCDV